MLQSEGQTCAIVEETKCNWRTVSKWMPLKLLPSRPRHGAQDDISSKFQRSSRSSLE